MFRLKLCGFTREKDVRAAIRLGVDAVGFQMSEGRRRITPVLARRLASRLPAWMMAVGVFVNEPVGRVNRLAAYCGFQVVQLHGDEDPRYLQRVSAPVIKVIRLKEALHPSAFQGYSVAAFLLDRYNRHSRGGTGVAVPWHWLRSAKRLPAPFLLAGGLNPDNVAPAIRACAPFGVDTASGVERRPGIKDPRKMAAFVTRARAAFKRLQGNH